MKWVLTGTNGFIGQALSRSLECSNCMWWRLDYRQFCETEQRLVLCDQTGSEICDDLDVVLEGAVVVHCAAIAHDPVFYEERSQIITVNFEKVIELYECLDGYNIKKFIFTSSIGVLGDVSQSSKSLSVLDQANPTSFYAWTKKQAEDGLREKTLSSAKAQILVMRLPVVYGSGAPGNMARLVYLCDKNWPIPVSRAKSRKSFLSISFLIKNIIEHGWRDGCHGSRFVVEHLCDPRPVSVAELIMCIRSRLGRCPRVFYVPSWLDLLLGLIPKIGSSYKRLNANLVMEPTAVPDSSDYDSFGFHAKDVDDMIAHFRGERL